jgi:hypothetical protein
MISHVSCVQVWEVAAQLTGYAVSWAVLSAVDALIVEQGGVSSGTELVSIWAVVQGTVRALHGKFLCGMEYDMSG